MGWKRSADVGAPACMEVQDDVVATVLLSRLLLVHVRRFLQSHLSIGCLLRSDFFSENSAFSHTGLMENQPVDYSKTSRQSVMYCKAGRQNPPPWTCQVVMHGVVSAYSSSMLELVETIAGREKNVITLLSSDGPNVSSIKGVTLGINLFTGF